MSRPEPPENPDPERFYYEAIPEDFVLHWRVVSAGPCRWTVGPGHTQCHRPGAAQLLRGKRWWNYCADHLYGRWIEGCRVWHWRLVRKVGAPQ